MRLAGRLPLPAPWLKDALWRKAQAVPSLDLRFADSKSLVDSVSGQNLITFTRASSATFVGSDGVLRTAATNEPRFDHNPTTGESLGLLVEEQRTNSIRNNTMVGAVAGTPGTTPSYWSFPASQSGLAANVVGTGVENGINYVDFRYFGTTTSSLFGNVSFEPPTSVAATQSSLWTHSAYLRLAGGSVANINAIRIVIDNYNSLGTALAQYALSPPISISTASLGSQRFSTSALASTFSNAATAFVRPYIQVEASSGVAIDITLRIGLPQLEQGAFATSVIPTTTAAATRAADVASITGTAFSSWYRQDEGTVFADFLRTYSGNFPGYPNIYRFDDGSSSNLFQLYGVQGNPVVTNHSVTSSGAAQTVYKQVSTNVPGPNRLAQALAVNSSTLAGNGTLTPQDNFVTMPVGINRVVVGQNWGGTIRRITYFPARLPNTTLQRLTQ